jgi:hypothetical protein
VQFGDLERVVEPPPGRMVAAVRTRAPSGDRERAGHHVVPPLPVLPVEAVAEPDEPLAGERGQAAEPWAGRVPVHDGLPAADQTLWRIHRGRVHGDKLTDHAPERPRPKLAVADLHHRMVAGASRNVGPPE